MDETFLMEDGIPLEGRVGLTLFRYLGVEGTYGKILATRDRVPEHDFPVDHYGLDLIINLAPGSNINPYIFGGWGELDLDDTLSTRVDMNGYEFGGGLKIALARKSGLRVDLRLEGRDVVVKNDPPLLSVGEDTHHIFITGGIHLELFGSTKDTDRDGVADQKDDCPGTPYGATVDSRGCPIDTDGDGVYDGLDLCAETPVGAVVDARGCPGDADGDGVLNGLDQCEGTLEGAIVDVNGCFTDADGDGVADGLDNCGDTPTSIRVDAFGCPKDSDGDGVFDGLDRCEGTPEGVEVDKNGCPIPITEMEQELVETGVIQIQNIYFDTGTSNLQNASHQVLHDVAAVLVKWPSLKIEIGGHADSRGDEELNLELSRKRAHSVLDYLIDNFEELRFGQFFVRGYGESAPVASNNTAAGRSRNRRVEFKVLNREALPKK